MRLHHSVSSRQYVELSDLVLIVHTVETHNTPNSCWVVLYGNVYDVSAAEGREPHVS